jgi:hypothetical protein
MLLKFAIWDNPEALCILAEGLDEPSRPFYFVIDRIYKLSQEQNVSKRFIDNLANGKNRFLHDIYIRALGVVGDTRALYELERLYTKYQHYGDYRATLYYAVRSMGLIGNPEIVPFLETLLSKYNDLQVQVSESNIVTALYLITGRTDYHFSNGSGERQRLFLTKSLVEARNVIVSSKDRQRTLNEMIMLDTLYRPPDLDA